MSNTNNKVKFGLKNCHYAKATLDPDTNAVTFGTPVVIRSRFTRMIWCITPRLRTTVIPAIWKSR